MALRREWLLLLLATLLVSLASRTAPQSVVPCITFNEAQTPGTVTIGVLTAVGLFDSISSSVRIMADMINNDHTILPNTTLRIVVYNTNLEPSLALSSFIKGATASPGVVIFIGPPTSGESTVVSAASSVDIFQIPLVSGSATSATLSDKSSYPYFSRVVPADSYQGQAIASLVAHFKWNKTACISTTNDYGVDGILAFEAAAANYNISIATYQQFLPGATNVFVQVRELLNSKARVFVAFMLVADFQTVLRQAQNATTNIIGPQYVWFCSDGCATNSDNYDANNNPVPFFQNATHGIIGTLPAVARGPAWDAFQSHWMSLNQSDYPGLTPPDEAFTYAGYYADATTAVAMGLDAVFRSGLPFNGTVLTNAIRNTTFMGLTGLVQFLPNGDREPFYDVVNFRNETNQTLLIGSWSQVSGLNLTLAPEFWSGSTTPPDLDVRPPYNYWSCFDKVERTDPTGKKVPLERPDFGNPNNINSTYICDGFLDCNNMSDEWDCAVSMPVVFVVFGIITGILFLIPILVFLPFTIIFGFIYPRSRVRQASPEFLLVMILACCLGYGSTYAWYGKPQVVACNFQSWLLGTGAILLLAALLVRGFRLWYLIFSAVRRPGKGIRFGVWKMFVMAFAIMVPAWVVWRRLALRLVVRHRRTIILALWTLISTPAAGFQNFSGKDHWVCMTGGFTGYPGGYVWFSILVGYGVIVLLFGILLGFLSRKADPKRFKEARLIAVSVYNLAFLCAIGIPVFFVLRATVPEAAWIIRTLMILYAFSATLYLQYVPLMWGVIIKDRLQKVAPRSSSSLGGSTTEATSASGSAAVSAM